MAVALESIVKQLTDSGIIAQGQLENFIPPKAHPKSVEDLVAHLVKGNHLTKFQAAQVAAGKSRSLILGEYTILDKIGAGGMGQVFKALHRRMDRLVAIKMLPPAMTKDAAAIARFEREVRAAAKLRHPNIVAADDAGHANGVHFLVMEYVDGQDLSQLVKKNGPFPVAKAVNYVLQAARGLEFAHKKGVVHRDIKPANLLLDSEGVVKILDMGLARIESQGNVAAQAELTGTGAIMGTVDYMAPEQGMSTKHADARADIYSLGCSLYYLIAGKATYDGETMAAKLLAHHTHSIPDLRSVQADVTDDLEAVFKKMVAKRLEDRYQSMTEVIADLDRLGRNSGTVNDPYAATAALNSGAMAARKGNDVLPSGGKQPPWKNPKVLIGAGAAGFLFLLLGVIVIVRNKDGQEVTRLEVADGNSVEVQPTTPATTTAPVTSTPHPAIPDAPPAKPITDFKSPEFLAWVKEVQAMSAEEQVKAVSKKLVELNPGFDGKLTGNNANGSPMIKNGVVKELGLFTENVTDISPVRALVGLTLLWCPGRAQGGGGKLFDLSPLEGMKLTSLNCGWTQTIDLSPLQQMKLAFLECGDTKVSSLSPLRGMPLAVLKCSHTLVSDLSPLETCANLTELRVRSTNVSTSSVAALQRALPNCKIEWDDPAKAATTQPNQPWNTPAFQAWMKEVQAMPAEEQVKAVSKKLVELNPGFDGKLTDADMKGTPRIDNGVVTELGFITDNVTSISPVRALAGLKSLNCSGSGRTFQKAKFKDIFPLQGMALTSLRFDHTNVSDLSPLVGMPLLTLEFYSTGVSSLAPLRGMSLTRLACGGTGISDLNPLAGMPLSVLLCNHTKVADLSATKGMPLAALWCHNTLISDLSLLAECKSLKGFSAHHTRVTAAKIEELKKALPNRLWKKSSSHRVSWR